MCRRRAVVGDLCRFHHDVENAEVIRGIALDLWDEIEYLLNHGEDFRDMEDRIRDAYDRGDINRQWMQRLNLRLILLDLGFVREEDDEDAPGDLEAFVADRQNVHREPVSLQTNRGLDVLLKVAMPAGQETLAEIRDAWGGPTKNKKLLRDMKRWYDRSMCREDDDWLYKRTLDSLWALIKTSEFRAELVKRLYEEAVDAEGMCCDGHITRLVNVMTGFHDEFSPHVSHAEQVQQRMSAISATDVSVEEKALEAWKSLAELNVPEADRRAWIEAF